MYDEFTDAIRDGQIKCWGKRLDLYIIGDPVTLHVAVDDRRLLVGGDPHERAVEVALPGEDITERGRTGGQLLASGLERGQEPEPPPTPRSWSRFARPK